MSTNPNPTPVTSAPKLQRTIPTPESRAQAPSAAVQNGQTDNFTTVQNGTVKEKKAIVVAVNPEGNTWKDGLAKAARPAAIWGGGSAMFSLVGLLKGAGAVYSLGFLGMGAVGAAVILIAGAVQGDAFKPRPLKF